MLETNQNTFENMGADIRIVGFNNEQTRRVGGSQGAYQVYIELSGTPPQAWGMIFEQEWKTLNAMRPGLMGAASIEREFLVLRCPLQDVVPTHLPFLRSVVAVTNRTYDRYAQELATERKQREGVWKRHRSVFDEVAVSPRVEPAL